MAWRMAREELAPNPVTEQDPDSNCLSAARDLYAEQIAMLYQSAPIAMAATLINGAVLGYVLGSQVGYLAASTWFACLFTVTAARGALYRAYRRSSQVADHARKWHLRYLYGALAAGTIWGSCTLVLFPSASVPHQVFIAFMLAGMTAGAVTVLSSRIDVAMAFLIPSLAPLSARFLLGPDNLSFVMGMVTLLYLVGVSLVARNLYGATKRILKLHLDKEILVKRLEAEKQETDQLNEKLVNEIRDRKRAEAALVETRDTLEIRVQERTTDLENEISERKAYSARLQYLAHHDNLTGLANRTLLLDRLRQAIARAERSGQSLSLMFVDLDRFKILNDSLGHAAGDALLKEVASRLQGCIRRGDTAARLGGDEFVILLEQLHGERDASATARKLLKTLERPINIEGQEFFVTGSIGVSLYPADGQNPDALLRSANAAMHRSKESGRNALRFYSTEMDARADERLSLERDLRHALENNELLLFYQPQISVFDGSIIGAEALLRWQHPRLGMIPPAKFIPVAEECGLIVSIGGWALQTACTEYLGWLKFGVPAIRLTVNLSPRQFMEAGFSELVARTLEMVAFEPSQLELEITENMLMTDVRKAAETLTKLKSIGVKFAVDDFGTGYSSLNYLKRFQLDSLKIDRSFILQLPDDPNDVAIARAIITLGRSLNLQVIAEGVENLAQLNFLKEHQCDAIQGYLFAAPEPSHKFLPLLLGQRILSSTFMENRVSH